MAKGNRIVIEPDARGRYMEGIIGAGLTPKPGTIMQIQAATAEVGGRFTWEIYSPTGTDAAPPAGPFIVLREDIFQSKTTADAYAAGDHCFGYVPLPGDELNLLVKNLSGTADDHAKGESLMVDDASGLMIAFVEGSKTKSAMLLEAITDPTADTLARCIWSGY